MNLALTSGLTSITARRVAADVGVAQGLVTHYFRSVDELLAGAFEYAVEKDRSGLLDRLPEGPLERIRVMIAHYCSQERDAISLLWLDAWRESVRRPLMQQAVIRQMERDLTEWGAVIVEGKDRGIFPAAGEKSAMRILSLIDGLAANAAVRAGVSGSTLDYVDAFEFVTHTSELELGLPRGILAPTG